MYESRRSEIADRRGFDRVEAKTGEKGIKKRGGSLGIVEIIH